MFEKQLEAYEKLKKTKVGALFMQMGTGKTKVACDLVNNTDCDLLVYICPFSIKTNVEKELIKWLKNKDYIIVGYETIQASDKTYLQLLSRIKEKTFIIADESIFIKNEETKRFGRLMKIRSKCEYALILNGTPITKSEWDIYNQMNFLSPLIIGMNRSEFNATFFTKVRYRKKGESIKEFYKFSEVNATYLYSLIEPYIFKSELEFDLEEKNDYRYVEIDLEEYHEEKMKNLTQYREEQSSEQIILMLQSLNKIVSCNKAKMQEVIKYVKDKQCIVYCNYLDEVAFIRNNIDCFVMTGETKNRKEVIEAFEKSDKPLVMTFGVGSYGLNLQFVNEIVYSSINFDYGIMEQSKYRIKRIGQTRDIKYTYILSKAGITDLIIKNISNKKNLKELLEEKIQKGVEKEWLKSI